MVLYLVLGKNGRDKVGHSFLVEACRIARDLGLFRLSSSSHSQKPCGVSDERWERSRAVAAWSIFNFQLYVDVMQSTFTWLTCAEQCLLHTRFHPSSKASLRFQYLTATLEAPNISGPSVRGK